MANISTETSDILNKTRGEDVRDALVDALLKISAEGLPDATSADNGKILAVDTSGKWVPRSITPKLSSIAVTTNPTKTSYDQGDTLDLTGIVVTATKTSDLLSPVTTEVTSSCTFSPADGATLSKAGTQTVTVSYTEDGVTKTTTFNVTVEGIPEVELSSIAITTRPTKMSYSAGDLLDLSGMVITATFSDGTSSTLSYNSSGVSCSLPNGVKFLTSGLQTETVSYTYNGVTKSDGFNISVAPVSASLAVTHMPNKTTYNSSTGYEFDSTGLVVSFTDTGDNTRDVTSQCTLNYEEGDVLTVPEGAESQVHTVTVYYVSGGQTYTTQFSVTAYAS